MPSIRIEIILNSNQKQKTLLLYDVNAKDFFAVVEKHAKNKLRVKSVKRIFDKNGRELDKDFRPQENMIIYVSATGEDFIGKVEATDEAKTKASWSLIAEKAFVEDEAVKQLERTVNCLKGMIKACGMPDLHPGKTYPIGAAFVSEGIIYPALIGGDIGCGMLLWELPLRSDIDARKVAQKLRGIEGPYDLKAVRDLLQEKGILETGAFDSSLGTVGGGNHFAELQIIEKIEDQEAFEALGLSKDSLYLLVHSGSRGYGQSILDEHVSAKKNEGLVEGSTDAAEYMKKHDNACNWASANRDLISQRVFDCLGIQRASAKKILDVWHNNVEKLAGTSSENGSHQWIHRKGAAPSDKGLAIVPGSRGAFSYLLQPTGDQTRNCFSLAHGAGRKLTRSKANSSLRNKFKDKQDQLQETKLGSIVICEDKDLLHEEAPEAYKDVEDVVHDLLPFSKIICILRPLVTYKVRSE